MTSRHDAERHAMLERDDFGVVGMTQAESGLVSEDIWNEMVSRLRYEFWTDFAIRVGGPGWRGQEPLSRGRHHIPESVYYRSDFLDLDCIDWEKLPTGAVWAEAHGWAWYRRESAVSKDATCAYRMIAVRGRDAAEYAHLVECGGGAW